MNEGNEHEYSQYTSGTEYEMNKMISLYLNNNQDNQNLVVPTHSVATQNAIKKFDQIVKESQNTLKEIKASAEKLYSDNSLANIYISPIAKNQNKNVVSKANEKVSRSLVLVSNPVKTEHSKRSSKPVVKKRKVAIKAEPITCNETKLCENNQYINSIEEKKRRQATAAKINRNKVKEKVDELKKKAIENEATIKKLKLEIDEKDLEYCKLEKDIIIADMKYKLALANSEANYLL